MNIEQERADFEAACRGHVDEAGYDEEALNLTRDGDGYIDKPTQAAWWGWREGRAALQSQHRGGYAGVTVWVDQIGCTKIIPKIQYKTSNADELLRNFEAARLAIDHARRIEGEGE